MYRYLLSMLCPVKRLVTTLVCVLLKGSNLVLRVRIGPKINFQACLWVLIRSRHIAICWLSIQHFIFFLIFCPETPKAGSCPANWWTVPSLASLSAISFPHTLEWPGTQNNHTECLVRMSFKVVWNSCTNRDVILATSRGSKASWLSEQILMRFSGLMSIWISYAQAKTTYISARKAAAYILRQILSLRLDYP